MFSQPLFHHPSRTPATPSVSLALHATVLVGAISVGALASSSCNPGLPTHPAATAVCSSPAVSSAAAIPRPASSLQLHVREERLATIARFDGNEQGALTFFDTNARAADGAARHELRGTLGFCGAPGQVFSSCLPKSVTIRSENAIQFGVQSSAVLTIREVGYPPGNGYVGIGTQEPRSIFEVSGEEAPRLTIASSCSEETPCPGEDPAARHVGGTWQMISGRDGEFELWDARASQLAIHVSPDHRVGIGSVKPSAELEVRGALRLAPARGREPPPCTQTVRGSFWFGESNDKSDDRVMVCARVRGKLGWTLVRL